MSLGLPIVIKVGAGMVTTPIELQRYIIQSVGCGDEILIDLLLENAGIAWTISCSNCYNGCSPIFYARLFLLELAMNYARNKVDVVTARGTQVAHSQYIMRARRESKGQRTSQSTACTWANATSFQWFNRQSHESDRDNSYTKADASHWFLNVGSDRSTEMARSNSQSIDSTLATSVGSGASRTDHFSRRTSEANDGTPTWRPVSNIQPGYAVYLGPGGKVLPGGISIQLFWDDPLVDNDANITIPPCPAFPPCTRPDDERCYEIYPSYGQGFSVHYNGSIGIPNVVTLNFAWSQGISFKQQYICGGGATNVYVRDNGRNNYDQVDQSISTLRASSHDESAKRNVVTRDGESHAESAGSTDALNTGILRSDGESHTGSDRKSYGEGRNEGQMTQLSTSKMTGDGYSNDEKINKRIARAWSQTFDALNRLWHNAMDEIREFERLSKGNTVAYGAIKPSAAQCNERGSQFIKRQIRCISCGNRGCSRCHHA